VDGIEPSFPASDFDDWAEKYDDSVMNDSFPFTGYPRVLERIVELAAPIPGMKVLDLGCGTGNLALPFEQAGCEVWCTDFSQPMLEKARQKLPNAHFYLHDLRTPLPDAIRGPFDRILSAYVFHHFNLAEKVRILQGLLPHLAVGGLILIGDVSFSTRSALEAMKTTAGTEWEDEFYWLAANAIPTLLGSGFIPQYEQVSACGGIFSLAPCEGTRSIQPSSHE
jgi:putative AdoMet-dependent methyltransferase